MPRLLLLFVFPFFIGCASQRGFKPADSYRCTVYSYTHFFRELPENERYIDKTMDYQNGHLISEQAFGFDGDTGDLKVYHYDSRGLLDSVIWHRPDVIIRMEYYYKESELHEAFNVYFGKRDLTERHIRTDSSHEVMHYLGGLFANRAFHYYNEEGQKIRTQFISPEGNDYGYKLYRYNEQGKLSEIIDYNSKGDLSETYTYSYDKRQNLLWEIITDGKGKLITKKKFEYSNSK